MSLNKITINDTTTVNTGIVYDISKATGQSYETLSDALSGNNVPLEVREGGMSIRFVQTSDNKYVQYRLITDEWSTNIEDWSFYGNDIYVDNPEFIEVTTDSEGKLLAGRTHDGAAFENVGFTTPKVSIDGTTIENIEDPEERTDILIDTEGKIISYRDSDGVKHEEVGIKTNHFELTEQGMTDFQ